MVEEYIKAKDKENMESLSLAAHLQRKMLPPRVQITETGFYTYLWEPKDIVSGDLLEVMPMPGGTLYILGDIQGHGTSASLSMMAVESFLKQLPSSENFAKSTPADIANLIQHFFTVNLGTLSYMTALICIHRPEKGIVDWISCGAPDLQIVDPMAPDVGEINPEHRGNLPIGLKQNTVYTEADVVSTRLSESALCVAYTDGVFDVYKDEDGYEPMPDSLRIVLQNDLLSEALMKSNLVTAPYKFKMACEACGYPVFVDDVTELIFGAGLKQPDVLVRSVPMDSAVIDKMAQEVEKWCSSQGWEPEIITKVELVFEEKMMNLFDHGYDPRDRAGEQAGFSLKKKQDHVEMTVWDWGTLEPSMPMAAGDLELELDLKNRDFSGRGRGRLMLRKICSGIERNQYGTLNETIYRITADGEAE
jgi:anti-sigma regulatory factor (Ser/Thr protein kinase)